MYSLLQEKKVPRDLNICNSRVYKPLCVTLSPSLKRQSPSRSREEEDAALSVTARYKTYSHRNFPFFFLSRLVALPASLSHRYFMRLHFDSYL